MSNTELFNQAIARYKTATGKNGFNDEVIVFLENEIEQYREKIKNLESDINDYKYACYEKAVEIRKLCRMCDDFKVQNERLKAQNETVTTLDAVQENGAAEIIKALSNNGYNTITINCYKDNESEV